MGYGGKIANGLSSLGPKMGGKAHGGGVNIGKGMGKISQLQDDVLSGKETKMENDSMGSAKIISGGHSKGKFMSTPKYKTDDQRKAAHASMAEQGAGKHGYKGPEKAKTMVKGPDGKMVPDYAVDGKGSKDLKGPHKESQDHKMAYDRSEISRLKKYIHYDDLKKKVKSVNEIGNRRRKDTYSYQEPKAKVLGGPKKMKKDKQKISKLQDDVLAGVAKHKYGK